MDETIVAGNIMISPDVSTDVLHQQTPSKGASRRASTSRPTAAVEKPTTSKAPVRKASAIPSPGFVSGIKSKGQFCKHLSMLLV